MCALKPPFRGGSLEQLYKNVTKGVYENIPKRYSSELSFILSQLLQTNPMKRPTCEELLNNPIVIKHIEDKDDIFEEQTQNELLSTIKMPKNISDIKQRLPKKKMYDSDKKLISVVDSTNANSEVKTRNEVSETQATEQLPTQHQHKQQSELKHLLGAVNNNINIKVVIKDNVINNRPISCGNQVKVKNVLGDNYVNNMEKINKLLNNMGNQDVKSRPMSSRPQVLRTNDPSSKKDEQINQIIKLNKMMERPKSPNRSPKIVKPVLDTKDRHFIEKVQKGDFRSRPQQCPQPYPQPKAPSPYENKANMLNIVNHRANERVFSQAPKIIRMNNRK